MPDCAAHSRISVGVGGPGSRSGTPMGVASQADIRGQCADA
jgi:hypothetical protein